MRPTILFLDKGRDTLVVSNKGDEENPSRMEPESINEVCADD